MSENSNVADKIELATIDGKVFKLPSTLEEFEIVERMEDAEIVKAMSGEIISNYFYRFNLHGNEVVELNSTGIFEIAQQYGGIEVSSEVISNNDSPDYEVISRALDKRRDIKFSGASQQSKKLPNGSTDNFALAKAVTKSERNSLKKVLPYSLVRKLLLNYIAEVKEQELITIRETCLQKLIDYGIKEEVFNEYCLSKYQKLFHELDADTAKRASAMLVKKDFREMLKKASE